MMRDSNPERDILRKRNRAPDDVNEKLDMLDARTNLIKETVGGVHEKLDAIMKHLGIRDDEGRWKRVK